MSANSTDLIEEVGVSLLDGDLPLRILNDPEIHRLELERIFGRHWVFIGHESEIPEPGDYARRYIGQDPFIFARDENGEVQVLFDSCRHRGTKICRAERGNTSHFRCPYHGWTYRNTGELIGVPHIDEGLSGMEREEWGLHRPPNVSSYKGLVFASLNEQSPPLNEYLGEFTWYLDIHLELTGGGMEVIGEPHRWKVDADWKTAAENFAGDDYHILITHQSAMEVGYKQEWMAKIFQSGKEVRRQIQCNGHMTSMGLIDRDEYGDIDPLFGYPPEFREYFGNSPLGEEQLDIAKQSLVHVGTIFPNLSFIHVDGQTGKDKGAFLSFRQWQPDGAGGMEVWSWVLVPEELPEELKESSYNIAMSKFSPAGNFEQDDVAVWDGIAASAGSVFTEIGNLKANYRMGMQDTDIAGRDVDWPGPGRAFNSHLTDAFVRHFYRRWYEAMSEEGRTGASLDETSSGPR